MNFAATLPSLCCKYVHEVVTWLIGQEIVSYVNNLEYVTCSSASALNSPIEVILEDVQPDGGCQECVEQSIPF